MTVWEWTAITAGALLAISFMAAGVYFVASKVKRWAWLRRFRG
jgi:hypothetical protein